MFSTLKKIFCKPKASNSTNNYMKYLIVGLGNIGDDYIGTRHNIGFSVLDQLSLSYNGSFTDKRYGFVSLIRVKNAELYLLKPSTYMNLSGNAVRYWLQKEKISIERMLVICDDISLPLGKIRIRPSGSDGGHNGLKHIISVLNSQQFNRLRFGIGNNYPRGGQADYVLGKFTEEEVLQISQSVQHAIEAIKTFCLNGITAAMNQYNKK